MRRWTIPLLLTLAVLVGCQDPLVPRGAVTLRSLVDSPASSVAVIDDAQPATPAKSTPSATANPPRLIVVVSVDQLCQEYFQRFAGNLDPDGFYALASNSGTIYTNCHHAHAFTLTGPGHAVQLTGTYPFQNGIIGNDWYDRKLKKNLYCVTDTSCTTIGAQVGDGPCSPKNLQVPTVGDMLKLATNKQAKVIGVSLKDRAAILMTGHLADAAYWFEETEGTWATSSYYRPDLPPYIRAFNESKYPDRYAELEWNLALPIQRYHHDAPDDYKYENPPEDLGRTFPHKLAPAGKKLYSQLRTTPYGSDMTLDVAKAVIENENLGGDEIPDLLCVNFSSNDYVGHAFGPQSLEVEDITIRTDRLLAQFYNYVVERVGRDNVVFALTADHGVCPLPELMKQKGMLHTGRDPLGGEAKVKAQLEILLRERLNLGDVKELLVPRVESQQLFLDRDHPALAGDKFVAAQRVCRDWLLAQKGIHVAITREDLLVGRGGGALNAPFIKTFHPERSGDVLWAYLPYYLCGGSGTTHGSPWRYDTHVPLVLLGAGIERGIHGRRTSPAMLAPTIAELFGVDAPAACIEEPLLEALSGG